MGPPRTKNGCVSANVDKRQRATVNRRAPFPAAFVVTTDDTRDVETMWMTLASIQPMAGTPGGN